LICVLSVCNIILLGQERFSIQLHSEEDINSKVANNRYLFSEFTSGTVIFTDNTATKADINYDIIMDEMHFTDAKGEVKALANNPADIVSIHIDGREFIHLRYGYAEVLAYSGNKALLISRRIKAETDKPTGAYGTASEVSAVERSSVIFGEVGTVGANSVKSDAVTVLSETKNITFNIQQTIYLQSNKYTYTGGNESNFIKVFGKNKKSMIHDYIKGHKLDLRKPTDLLELFNYLADNI